MSQTRREFLLRAAALCGGSLTGWAEPPRANAAPALRATADFLAGWQSDDGAWRSHRYGAFREGDALTPLVLWALTSLAVPDAETVARGMRWLEKLTDTQSARPEPWTALRYPLFTASYAAQVFAKAGDKARTDFWADVVEQFRIAPTLGWPADSAACGAWSDASAPPRLPGGAFPPPDMLAPNLSATTLALAALVAAGRSDRAASALPFLARCQNFSAMSPEGFDDGGFFFAPGDAVRNKAGVAGRDAAGHARYHSYGSATCDGFLALDACGVSAAAPRARAALGWLRRNADGSEHSGTWAAGRMGARDSLRFYHAQALAGVLAINGDADEWAAAQRYKLTGELCAAQSCDGSWRGACPDSFEDDPVVATAFAVRALA